MYVWKGCMRFGRGLTRVFVTAYFDAVSSEFEMEDRIETINQKIDYASEVQSTLRALLTEVSIR